MFLWQKVTGWISQLPRSLLMEVGWKPCWCTCQELLPSVGSWNLLCCCCQSCITVLKKSCLNEEIWNNQSIRDVLSGGKICVHIYYIYISDLVYIFYCSDSLNQNNENNRCNVMTQQCIYGFMFFIFKQPPLWVLFPECFVSFTSFVLILTL